MCYPPLKGQCHEIFDPRFFFIKTSLTPHAQQIFQTTSKSENHMQNSNGMQKN
jgi:hypothetical protein